MNNSKKNIGLKVDGLKSTTLQLPYNKQRLAFDTGTNGANSWLTFVCKGRRAKNKVGNRGPLYIR